MNTHTIHVAEQYGTDLSNRYKAAQLRGEIECSTLDHVFTLDFEGVRTVSDSFADELFAVLVAEKGEQWFRDRIRVINTSEHVRRTILQTIFERLGHVR